MEGIGENESVPTTCDIGTEGEAGGDTEGEDAGEIRSSQEGNCGLRQGRGVEEEDGG